MARIKYGPGNVIVRDDITHTDQIGQDVYQFFGASRENTELSVGGVTGYRGPLQTTDIVEIRQKANAKAA